MAKDKKDQAEQAEKQAPAMKRLPVKMIVIIAAALVFVVGGAVAAYLFMLKSPDKKEPAQKPVVVTIWPMDAFVVNLTDGGGDRYLKLVVQLEVSEPGVVNELQQIKPRLRDSILDLLTPKSYQELIDLAGKQRLREDIAGRVNNMLTNGKVTKVYFTEFVIQ